MAKERYKCTVGDSSKFWEPEVRGKKLVVKFGKIGTAGQVKEKVFASKAEATRERDRLVREKTKKGYAFVTGGVLDSTYVGAFDECEWDAMVHMARELTRVLKAGYEILGETYAPLENLKGVNIDNDALFETLDGVYTRALGLGADQIGAFSDNERCYLLALRGTVDRLQMAMAALEWGEEDFNEQMLDEYSYFDDNY